MRVELSGRDHLKQAEFSLALSRGNKPQIFVGAGQDGFSQALGTNARRVVTSEGVGQLIMQYQANTFDFGVRLANVGKVTRHSKYVTFQLAEVAVTQNLFAAILYRIAQWAIPPPILVVGMPD